MSLAIMFLIMVSSLSFDDILGQTFAALYIRAAKAGAESIIGSGILDAFCRGSTEIEYQIMYLAIITLPLLGSIASGLFGRKIGVTGSQLITSSLVILTTLLAIAAYFEVGLNSIPVSIKLFTWNDSESFSIFLAGFCPAFKSLERAKGFSTGRKSCRSLGSLKNRSRLDSCPVVFNSLDVGYESIKFAFLGVSGVYMLINKKDPKRFYIGSSVNLSRRILEYIHLIKGIRQPNSMSQEEIKKTPISDWGLIILDISMPQLSLINEQFALII
jgi:hypothetical protein